MFSMQVRIENIKFVIDFRELCSGMGAMGQSAVQAGFRVVGVKELQDRTAAVASEGHRCERCSW